MLLDDVDHLDSSLEALVVSLSASFCKDVSDRILQLHSLKMPHTLRPDLQLVGRISLFDIRKNLYRRRPQRYA